MIVYLDTSVVLRRLFSQPDALAGWGHWDQACSSALLEVEASRAIDRLRLLERVPDMEVSEAFEALRGILKTVDLVPLSDTVLRRASQPFPTVVKTLDAIHLATAILWQDQHRKPLAFLTHDVGQETAARALGFKLTL